MFSILVIVCEFWHLKPLIYSFQGFLCFGVHRVPLHSVWVFVPFVSWFVSFVLISFNWFLFPDRFPSPDCPLCFCVYISSFHLFFVRSLFAHLASFFSLLKYLQIPLFALCFRLSYTLLDHFNKQKAGLNLCTSVCESCIWVLTAPNLTHLNFEHFHTPDFSFNLLKNFINSCYKLLQKRKTTKWHKGYSTMYYAKGDKVSTEALLSIQRIQSALSMPF